VLGHPAPPARLSLTLACCCLLLPPLGGAPAARAAAPAPARVLSLKAPLRGAAGSPAWRQQQQRLAALGADGWHALGHRGRGVKVAVLDTGFRGYKEHLGKALPARLTARSFRSDGNLEARDSQHGILCGEVIHAIAPEAELLFANWDIGQEDQFLAAVGWARRQGARVISCSVIMPSWSDGEGNGAVHRALAELLGPGKGPGDLLCFASAGNTTKRHWAGAFRDGGGGYHEWQPGRADNPLTPSGEDFVAVELYGRPGSDYTLSVYEEGTGKQVGEARTDPRQADRTSAAVRFRPEEGRDYRVRVRRGDGPAGLFHVTTTFGYLALTTPASNICFPADGPGVVALGAADEEGRRMSWSARGPNSPQPKPDLVATAPFPSSWRARPFSGTSSAAPQAAALAALCLSRHPDWSADQLRRALRDAARDLRPAGHDWETGYGLIRLPAE
jgi:hypothetical protein